MHSSALYSECRCAECITQDLFETQMKGGAIRSKIVKKALAANDRYAEDFGDKGNLPMLPGRRFAILTCMDARLDPAKYAGLAVGMPMSFMMQVDGLATMQSVHW